MMAKDTRGLMWPKFPDICLTVEENSRKNLNQELTRPGIEPEDRRYPYMYNKILQNVNKVP